MSDEEPNLTAPQDQEVRRLLADARHDEPIPEDVAARLDRVLAQLAAGDPEHDPRRVIELTSQRRRRAASLLVAAAAIVAVGVGLAQVVGTGTGTNDSNADTAMSDTQSGVAPEEAPKEAGAQDEPGTGTQSLSNGVGFDTLYAASAPIKIRAEHFAADVERARRAAAFLRNNLSPAELDSAAATSGDQADGQADGTDSAAAPSEPATWFECTPADFGKGRLIPVLYDGESAVLALRRPVGDTQVVELLQCGSGEILRSITLPTS